MRTVDQYGVEVTSAPTNPSTTISEIDGTPSIAAHTLQVTENDAVTNLGLGRASVNTGGAGGFSVGGKLRLARRFF